ncbi:ricin-type beta-trefoil lectin domain protein [Streptomyces sp. NPDC088387]|uniref:ricin-type beta-trefoil lectin domain protein n=1 Tax=Streptomyces sp. NPDC088387 TaxID=3365859 RepID=UPI0038135218
MLDGGLSNSPYPSPHPVGELLDRHWEAAFAYARLCTDGSRAAGMLTTAAFTRLFGQLPPHGGPSPIWRQRLLVAVRRIAAEWGTDDKRALLHPELRPDGPNGTRASLQPPSERRLVAAAFQRLPESARCLLWHAEVESDALSVPGALLDLDDEGAAAELRRAAERLRSESVQVHHELAPSQRCRHFSRMLDVTCRRGGTEIDPDLGTHLDACPHCWHTADQLCRFDAELGLVLAEAVLGWGARDYVAQRAAGAGDAGRGPAHAVDFEIPPRPAAPAHVEPPPPGPPPTGGSFDAVPAATRGPRPPAPRIAARRAAARRRNRAAAVLTVSALIAVPLGLWIANGSGDGAAVAGTNSDAPDTNRAEPSSDPSGIEAAAAPEGDVRGRLHNVASGLCLTVADGKVAKGAETELADCSDDTAQQWSYETDGLLRSVADPGLCVDSHVGHSVRLGACADSKDVRYDFTVQGALVPRWDQDLALAPAATDGSGNLMVKMRDGSETQRWVIDTSQPDLRMAAVNWDGVGDVTLPPTARPTPTAKPSSKPSKTASPSPSTSSAPAPTPTAAQPTAEYPYPCYPYYYCDGNGDDGWGDGDGGGDGRGDGGGGRGGR